MKHWNEDEILNHLYGLRDEDTHLRECAECQERLRALQDRRRSLGEPVLDPGFLAAQRRAVYARMEGPFAPRRRLGLIPAMAATAAVVVVGLAVWNPSFRNDAGEPRLGKQNGDSQLYMDIYARIGEEVPRSAAPIRGLFED